MRRGTFVGPVAIVAIAGLGMYMAIHLAGMRKAPVTRTEFLMGTIVTVKAYGPGAKPAIDEAFARLHDIEDKMSVNIEKSEVSRINASAGRAAVRVSDDVFYVIKKALDYAALTGGSFDPAIGPLVDLWGIGTDHAKIPAQSQIKAALRLANYQNISLDPETRSVMLKLPGMKLDLGGIVKGYAADEVARIFRKHGVKSAYVDLGGNVSVVGNKPDGRPWRVAIQDPRGQRGSYVGVIEARDMTLVTSGDYERYFEANGKRYHHILSPVTGWPAQSGLMSVTIIGRSSIDADALSTGVFVLGPERGMRLIESLKGIEAVLITKDRHMLVSSGLAGLISEVSKEYYYYYEERR